MNVGTNGRAALAPCLNGTLDHESDRFTHPRADQQHFRVVLCPDSKNLIGEVLAHEIHPLEIDDDLSEISPVRCKALACDLLTNSVPMAKRRTIVRVLLNSRSRGELRAVAVISLALAAVNLGPYGRSIPHEDRGHPPPCPCSGCRRSISARRFRSRIGLQPSTRKRSLLQCGGSALLSFCPSTTPVTLPVQRRGPSCREYVGRFLRPVFELELNSQVVLGDAERSRRGSSRWSIALLPPWSELLGNRLRSLGRSPAIVPGAVAAAWRILSILSPFHRLVFEYAHASPQPQELIELVVAEWCRSTVCRVTPRTRATSPTWRDGLLSKSSAICTFSVIHDLNVT